MPHYLILIPELDYERLYQGDPNLSRCIVMADDPQDAILARINKDDDPDYEYDTGMVKSARVVALAGPGVYCASLQLLERLRDGTEKRKLEKQKAREIAELRRLVAKHGKEVL